MSLATITDRYTAEQIDRFYAEGLWKRETLWQEIERQVEIRPDKPFIIDDSTQLTFRQTKSLAGSLVAGLTSIGIGPGDRVAVQIPNWVEFAPIVIAISRVGAIAVPIQPIRGPVQRHGAHGLVIEVNQFTQGTLVL